MRGAEGVLKDPSRRPRMVLLELFDENLKPFELTVESVVDHMKDLGYSANVVPHGGQSLRPFDLSMAQSSP